MDGYDRLSVVVTDVKVGSSFSIHGHLSPRATAPVLPSRDDITVHSTREASGKEDVQRTIVVIDRYEALVASSECYLVASVVPPVTKDLLAHHVAKHDHISDWWPSVFTHPPIPTAAV